MNDDEVVRNLKNLLAYFKDFNTMLDKKAEFLRHVKIIDGKYVFQKELGLANLKSGTGTENLK
jgi:hypothetical protein